jgi:hypothetical protein
MAEHFGGSGDSEIDFIEVLDFLPASESDAICLVLCDIFGVVSFVHYFIYNANNDERGKAI